MTINKATFDALPQPKVESSARWVRVQFNGEFIAGSTSPLLLLIYSPDLLPTYCFRKDDVEMEALIKPYERDGRRYYTVRVGEKEAPDAAWEFLSMPPHLADVVGTITFEWNKSVKWFEEAEEIHVHARDPHKRVDVLESTRHIEVQIGGETIADTHHPYLLFETSLPTRYYVPREDVNMDYLHATDYTSMCPYKGTANYWSVEVGDDVWENVVWSYETTLLENPKIKDLMCFFNEKVDIYIDGELQTRPKTPWS